MADKVGFGGQLLVDNGDGTFSLGVAPPTTAAFADEVLTVSTTVVGLTAATYAPDGENPATVATAGVSGGPIRFRISGADPTSSLGYEVADGGTFTVTGADNIANLLMIRSDTTDASVFVTYER